MIHNHFHKCGASCFKKNHRSKSGVTICRFGCVHFEKVEVKDEKGKTDLKKNTNGKIVSKKASASGKKTYVRIKAWVVAVMEEEEWED